MNKSNKNNGIQSLLGTSSPKPVWARKSTWLTSLVATFCIGIIYVFFLQERHSQFNYVTEDVSHGPLVVEVSANGTLQPIRTVSLGSELSGIVREVKVDVNDEVTTGEVLIQLDDTKLKASVERAKATLALSLASLAEAKATLAENTAKLNRLKEVRKLSGGKSPSKTEIDAQEASVARAQASVESAEAGIVDSKEALKSAETDLSKTSITSPIDGVVLARDVEPGYAVAASLQAVELLSLATDLSELELQVNVDEADVGSVKVGQQATFTVSAYPDKRFPATLNKVAYGSTTTDNVVTYVTYLKVDNRDMELRPGMTATASIRTVSLKDALLVPNTSLRFRPVVELKATSGNMATSLFGPPQRRSSTKSAKETATSSGARKEGTVYVLRDGELQAVDLIVGYTDGRMTQVISGDLKAGDRVVVDQRRGTK